MRGWQPQAVRPRDVMLAEATRGPGHVTRKAQPRRGIFIPLPSDFDLKG